MLRPSWLCSTDSLVCGSTLGEVWMKRRGDKQRDFLGTLHNTPSFRGIKVFNAGPFLWTGSRNDFKVFDTRNKQEVIIGDDFQQRRFRGLGDVLMRDDTFLAAFGRGVGKAYVWRFEMQEENVMSSKYLGAIHARSNTIAVLKFSDCGKFLISTTHGFDIFQVWNLEQATIPFDFKTSQSVSSRATLDTPTLEKWLGSREAALSVLEQHRYFDNDSDPREYHKTSPEWESPFPLRLLEPFAYDGDVDSFGRPNGYGEQADEETNMLYEGGWVDGEKRGNGTLSDIRSGKLVYSGSWKNCLRHGFGKEYKGTEMYEGWWRHGHRHGIGKLFIKKHCFTGCFSKGKRHGMGFLTWPKNDPAIPFRVTLASIEHLGAIRCIQSFKNDKFCNEFSFVRVDGKPISELDKLLFNIEEPTDISFRNMSHNLGICWVCLGSITQDRVSCANKICPVMFHRKCIGKKPSEYFNWDRNLKMYCSGNEDESEENMNCEDDAPDIGDDWYCPVSECQAIFHNLQLSSSRQNIVEDLSAEEEIPPVQVKLTRSVVVSDLNDYENYRSNFMCYESSQGELIVITSPTEFEVALEEQKLQGKKTFQIRTD